MFPESLLQQYEGVVSEADCQERLAFLEITDDDLATLRELHPVFLGRREAWGSASLPPERLQPGDRIGCRASLE